MSCTIQAHQVFFPFWKFCFLYKTNDRFEIPPRNATIVKMWWCILDLKFCSQMSLSLIHLLLLFSDILIQLSVDVFCCCCSYWRLTMLYSSWFDTHTHYVPSQSCHWMLVSRKWVEKTLTCHISKWSSIQNVALQRMESHQAYYY